MCLFHWNWNIGIGFQGKVIEGLFLVVACRGGCLGNRVQIRLGAYYEYFYVSLIIFIIFIIVVVIIVIIVLNLILGLLSCIPPRKINTFENILKS